VREALAVRIDVSQLTNDDGRALVNDAYRLPEEHADRLVSYVQGRAEGNPFFVVELLRALEGGVLLPAENGDWRLGALGSGR
jgi:predicted ATPase